MAIWDTVLKALKNAFLNEKDALGYTIPFFGFAILIVTCFCCCSYRLLIHCAYKKPKKKGGKGGCCYKEKEDSSLPMQNMEGNDIENPGADGSDNSGASSSMPEQAGLTLTGGEKDLSSSGESKWREVNDRQGRTFYFNHETGESRWTDPHNAKKEEDLHDDWEAIHDEQSKKQYFYNSKTGESTWTKPYGEAN